MDGKKIDRTRAHEPHPPPRSLPGFPNAVLTKPKAEAGKKPRPRWKEKDGTFYEFDRRHGTVEKYDPRGKHQAEFTIDGNPTKPPNPDYKAIP